MQCADRGRSADRDIVGRDPSLPGLAMLFDPGAFANALGAVFPERIEHVTPTYVRYKQAMNCLVSYRVHAAHRTYHVYAKAHRREDAAKVAKAAARGSLVLDEYVTASFFPLDAKLKSLRRLTHEGDRRRLLRRLLPSHPETWPGAMRELRYKPERRYVTRLDIDGQPVAALKFFTPAGYATAYLGAGAFVSGESLRVPARIGRSKRHRILAYEWLPGSLLSDRLASGDFSADDVRRVGAALAELHDQSVDGLTARGLDEERASLAEVASAVSFLDPRLAGTVDRLADRISRGLGEHDPIASPVHGDFYGKQVLLQDDGVAVLDFDESALADPVTDLGNFIAHLERDVLRGRMDRDAAELARGALLDGYACSRERPSTERVRLYTARCLLALSPHPFRFRETNWPDVTSALLERSIEILDAGGRPSAPRPRIPQPPTQDVVRVTRDPAFTFVSRALDPEVAAQQLRTLFDGAGCASNATAVPAVRVMRHKPGRRLLIEYENGSVALIGKVRARGLDSRTYEVCRRLWNHGFGEASPDRISTPEPIGCIPEWNMWLQRKVQGVPSTERLHSPDATAVIRRIAAGLHKLNRCGPATRRRHGISDELAILYDRLPIVADRHGLWERRIDRVLAGCDRVASAILEPQPQPIHRDLHAGNVLVDGDRTYFLDLDLYAMGDPALDAGNFIGHLTELALRRTGDAYSLRHLEDAFEDTFVGFIGESRRQDVRRYATLTLARHIYISTLFEERRATTGALIDLCEERLAEAWGTEHALVAGGGSI